MESYLHPTLAFTYGLLRKLIQLHGNMNSAYTLKLTSFSKLLACKAPAFHSRCSNATERHECIGFGLTASILILSPASMFTPLPNHRISTP